MAGAGGVRWIQTSAVLVAAISASAAAAAAVISALVHRRTSRRLALRVLELEDLLAASVEKGAAERRGRVRAQQDLRKALAQGVVVGSTQASSSAYPMVPIGTVHSCFSTRNGTPRQPLLVPFARACLALDPGRVPSEALQGLADYSHCWILYVFHLNTDLDKLWKEPSRSKFKAKVRVPKLKGGKMGVLATRSPHRPCPIGLTVARVEALDGHMVLLSGVDLVDGTPVLDIKPYLPYSDSIQGAVVPKWVEADHMLAVSSVNFSEDFHSSLSSCWPQAEKHSLYASEDEFQSLVKEVLAWDIRSMSQRSHPHNVTTEDTECNILTGLDNAGNIQDSCEALCTKDAISSLPSYVVYHLVLEGIDISYRIDDKSNIIVEKAEISSSGLTRHCCSNLPWLNKLRQKN